MSRHPAHLLLSAAAWLGFVVVTVWTMAFLAGVVVPRTVDGPDRTTTARAVAIDLALLLFFAVQHSVMARRQVKSWLSRRIPPALERTSYVLATDICLALLCPRSCRQTLTGLGQLEQQVAHLVRRGRHPSRDPPRQQQVATAADEVNDV